MAGDTSERKFDQTPTWAVAGVCAVIIIISIALEKVLHKVGKLMVLGFISLILNFTQYNIAKICIPIDIADKMLPCDKKPKSEKVGKGAHRLLLWYEHHRSLADGDKSNCGKDKVSIISVKAMHQIHILIFFLAVLHVANSAITMALGRLKTRRWKQWEEETSYHDYEFSNDSSRFRLTHETSFVRDPTPVFGLESRYSFIFTMGIVCDLASKCLRLGGNILGVDNPIILAVGTKLQAILTKMALEITERHAVVQGMPLVQASDKYFWFSRPSLILHLIHFALFQSWSFNLVQLYNTSALCAFITVSKLSYHSRIINTVFST
ncbi:hypothetical protein L1987_43495 [Smallanthus sonchifolius]|uniref:Uncharacterized protein n=1 Tax=Smallanthus sonchifolius TaxID=185202 RepID=A0ACB9GMS9_9ASTR|nr:hypothetical protein L1987_43495 [Smallanthus sonchifolius]